MGLPLARVAPRPRGVLRIGESSLPAVLGLELLDSRLDGNHWRRSCRDSAAGAPSRRTPWASGRGDPHPAAPAGGVVEGKDPRWRRVGRAVGPLPTDRAAAPPRASTTGNVPPTFAAQALDSNPAPAPWRSAERQGNAPSQGALSSALVGIPHPVPCGAEGAPLGEGGRRPRSRQDAVKPETVGVFGNAAGHSWPGRTARSRSRAGACPAVPAMCGCWEGFEAEGLPAVGGARHRGGASYRRAGGTPSPSGGPGAAGRQRVRPSGAPGRGAPTAPSSGGPYRRGHHRRWRDRPSRQNNDRCVLGNDPMGLSDKYYHGKYIISVCAPLSTVTHSITHHHAGGGGNIVGTYDGTGSGVATMPAGSFASCGAAVQACASTRHTAAASARRSSSSSPSTSPSSA